jgi:hypothetical protein
MSNLINDFKEITALSNAMIADILSMSDSNVYKIMSKDVNASYNAST